LAAEEAGNIASNRPKHISDNQKFISAACRLRCQRDGIIAYAGLMMPAFYHHAVIFIALIQEKALLFMD
jgi:hypothetical protein